MQRANAPGYDRFKTVVAVILAIILLLMLLRGCAAVQTPSAPSEVFPIASATNLAPTSALPTQTAPAAVATETEVSTSSPTAVPPTVAPTATPTTSVTATSTPASAATEAPTATTEQATATPTQTQAASTSCNTVAPSRLSVGQKARVIQRLNVRSNPSIQASILKVNPINTQVDLIGGPTCEPVGEHAYLWWQIRLADGTEGWSAESPLNSGGYFLEPVP